MRSRTPESAPTPDPETLEFIREGLKPHLPESALIELETIEPDEPEASGEADSGGQH